MASRPAAPGGAVLVELSREEDDLHPQGMYRLEKKISANGEIVEQEVFDKPKADTFRGYLDDIAKELGERKKPVVRSCYDAAWSAPF